MADILDTIVARKHEEISSLCAPKPSLRAALLSSPTSIIAEFKRRSPSRGWIHESASAAEVPLAYQQAGAAAISILTDESFFGGCDDFIRVARASGVTLPILYKNFVVDELQIYEALFCGASAVLLIAACLSHQRCSELIALAHELGLEVLLEIHGEEELSYTDLNADCIGVNNRNLGTFHTDVQNSFTLAPLLAEAVSEGASGAGPVFVSESGISDPETIRRLRSLGYRGFLIGETFMKTKVPGEALRQFIYQL